MCLNKIFILTISARVLSYRVVETAANTFQLTKVSIHFDIHQICNVNVFLFLFWIVLRCHGKWWDRKIWSTYQCASHVYKSKHILSYNVTFPSLGDVQSIGTAEIFENPAWDESRLHIYVFHKMKQKLQCPKLINGCCLAMRHVTR